MPAPRNTTIRDRHRRVIRARKEPCALCNRPIDYTLRTPDPWSFEVDHIIPLDLGGPDTIDNKQPAHRRCNRTKWNRLEGSAPPPPKPEPITTQRRWWLTGHTGGGFVAPAEPRPQGEPPHEQNPWAPLPSRPSRRR